MKTINLFPYRAHRRWEKRRSFQKAVVVIGTLSLLLSVLVNGFLRQAPERAWGQSMLNQSGDPQQGDTHQRLLVEQMHNLVMSTEWLNREREQRLLLLRLMHTWLQPALEGVSLRRLNWSEGVLEMEMGVATDEIGQQVIQKLQGSPGVQRIEHKPTSPALVCPGLRDVHLKIHVGGES